MRLEFLAVVPWTGVPQRRNKGESIVLGSTDIHRQSEIVLGACGGQRCLAGDGALHSSEMPAAKVILLFLSLLHLKAADVKAVVVPQP